MLAHKLLECRVSGHGGGFLGFVEGSKNQPPPATPLKISTTEVYVPSHVAFYFASRMRNNVHGACSTFKRCVLSPEHFTAAHCSHTPPTCLNMRAACHFLQGLNSKPKGDDEDKDKPNLYVGGTDGHGGGRSGPVHYYSGSLEDNQSTISVCYNKVQNQRSKHILMFGIFIFNILGELDWFR